MHHRPSTLTYRRTLLREAIAVMEEEYASDLSLDDVARRIATSRRQLQRCFADHSTTTFRGYLGQIRMARAAELLAGTDLPVAAVARRVGYTQPAQFAKAFRRHLGTTPMAYRRRVSETPLAAA